MPPLKNSSLAEFDIRKLRDYCLDPAHPRGRHKARVFRNSAGIARQDAPWLRQVLLQSLAKYDAIQTGADILGSRWRVDVPLARQGREIVVRTVWIVRSGEEFPRFVTCWVL